MGDMLWDVFRCSADECETAVHARGLCAKHYRRMARTGSTKKRTNEQWFWTHVNKTSTCWLWTGSQSATGYGQWRLLNGKTVQAHRFAYESMIGPIPEGMVLDHVWTRGCRSALCVRPGHLEPVSPRTNTLRAWQARRERARLAAEGIVVPSPNAHARKRLTAKR